MVTSAVAAKARATSKNHANFATMAGANAAYAMDRKRFAAPTAKVAAASAATHAPGAATAVRTSAPTATEPAI